MTAHICTIGDEILIGQITNTNAAYIAKELSAIQITVGGISVVGDDEGAIIGEFERVWEKNDILIVTGGLGPTHDDITRAAIAKFFDSELIMDESVLSDLKDYFNKRGREMSPSNEQQALVVKGAEVIKNFFGTAPGTWLEREGRIFISMPGVPFEMKAMMKEFVLPGLSGKYTHLGAVRVVENLLTTGIPESVLFDRLGDIEELLEGAKMAFLPSQFGTKIRITVIASSQTEALNKLSGIEQKIRSKAGRYIYGREEETLEEVVARLLNERGLTISVAESCTGGLISNRLTNISGSSQFYLSGIITYSNESKVSFLKVPLPVINQYGAVSEEVVKLMAEGVKTASLTDIGIAITGIMGPTGETYEKQIGLTYIGIFDGKTCTARKFVFGQDRLMNKDRASQAALEMLRRYLLGISYDE